MDNYYSGVRKQYTHIYIKSSHLLHELRFLYSDLIASILLPYPLHHTSRPIVSVPININSFISYAYSHDIQLAHYNSDPFYLTCSALNRRVKSRVLPIVGAIVFAI